MLVPYGSPYSHAVFSVFNSAADCSISQKFGEDVDQVTADTLQRSQFDPKFQVEGIAPPIIFARIVRLMNALQLCR